MRNAIEAGHFKSAKPYDKQKQHSVGTRMQQDAAKDSGNNENG